MFIVHAKENSKVSGCLIYTLLTSPNMWAKTQNVEQWKLFPVDVINETKLKQLCSLNPILN